MSTYPMDVRHVEHLLPHQIRALDGMVDRFIVTIDTHQTRTGRYQVDNFEANLEKLRQLVRDARKSYPRLEFMDVDYSAAMRREVARYFFDTDSIPIKAWDGGPFYSYFFGLYATGARHVLHFDGDMMFGGGSRTWIRDATACLERHPDVLLMAPFPGPPRADGAIFGHQWGDDDAAPAREPLPALAYRHMQVSTRAFLIDLQRFKSMLGHFPLLRPSLRQRLKARLMGNEPEARQAEVLMTLTMQNRSLYRLDFLGSEPGLWTLHPPYRTELFYRRLPELISVVEQGTVPDGQRGHYDLNDSLIDWHEARAANQWHRRYLRMIRQRFATAS
jgi:hypothetical protein